MEPEREDTPGAPGRPGDKQVYHRLLWFKSTSRAELINLGTVVENSHSNGISAAEEKTRQPPEKQR